jgi:cytochrome c2
MQANRFYQTMIPGPTAPGALQRRPSKLCGGFGITWTSATLNQYLTNPRAMVPDTSMIYPGLKDSAQRAYLIAYLAILH